MPILAAEPSLFPENLFEDFLTESPDGRWWVVYTMARQEKALSRQLLHYGVSFYLPLVAKDNFIRGRTVRSHVPLFSGYVFLFGTDEERVLALTSNRISRILPVEDQGSLWHDLRQVSRLIESDAPLTVERRLTPGQPVRVKAGAMAGLEGTVVRQRNSRRLLIAVDFLQQGVSVAMDDFMVEPID